MAQLVTLRTTERSVMIEAYTDQEAEAIAERDHLNLDEIISGVQRQ